MDVIGLPNFRYETRPGASLRKIKFVVMRMSSERKLSQIVRFHIIIIIIIIIIMGRDSSVGIATHYGPDGPRIESRWGEIFRTRPDWPWGPPSLL